MEQSKIVHIRKHPGTGFDVHAAMSILRGGRTIRTNEEYRNRILWGLNHTETAHVKTYAGDTDIPWEISID